MKRSMLSFSLKILALVRLLLNAPESFAQDTIRPGDGQLRPSLLTRGFRQYLVYSQTDAQPKIIRPSIWARRSLDSLIAGKPVIVTYQQWKSADSAAYREVLSINRSADFTPVYHEETIGTSRKAYDWTTVSVTGTGSDSIRNRAAGFNLILPFPVFNWNLDMETFTMLPFRIGAVFLIPFYDAGYGPPTYSRYEVTGSERIATYQGAQVDCWVLRTGGKAPNGRTYSQTFWFAKKDQEFLKEADEMAGNQRVKIKLPVSIPSIF